MEELVRPDDMLMVEERIEDKLLLDIEELAVRDERLPDIISEPDDPAETPAPPDEELEVEAPPLREVEEYPNISVLKALTKLPPALEKIPGLTLR
jgi:hypothetical protein